jgi:hypothetical protein
VGWLAQSEALRFHRSPAFGLRVLPVCAVPLAARDILETIGTGLKSMSEYTEVKDKAAKLMSLLVNPDTRWVRFSSLMDLHASLNRHGFRVIQKQPFGPPGGFQIVQS